MKTKLTRILNINFENLKNTNYGNIDIGSYNHLDNGISDIRGIYGQNGSGKTTLINAVEILKSTLEGNPLPAYVNDIISQNKDNSSINTEFAINIHHLKFQVYYEIKLLKNKEKTIIEEESLKFRSSDEENNNWSSLKTLISINYLTSTITPARVLDDIGILYENKSDLLATIKLSSHLNRSYIFSSFLEDMVNNSNLLKEKSYFLIITTLRMFSRLNLIVINNKHSAYNNANIALPIIYKDLTGDSEYTDDSFIISLEQNIPLKKRSINNLKNFLISANIVLTQIIPGLTLDLKEISKQISKENEEEVVFEILACRGEEKIPLRYESDGIKKIISLLNVLISVFNNPQMSVFIDEFDSGVYEYLLGEILHILEERGLGQLIFTSHNLRPLEVLNKSNIIFTTSNPNNRFIKFKDVKNNNNLRDLYYREIILGGQKESMYDGVSSGYIARAFRRAGEFIE